MIKLTLILNKICCLAVFYVEEFVEPRLPLSCPEIIFQKKYIAVDGSFCDLV